MDGLLVLIVTGLVVGCLAGVLVRGGGFRILGDIVAGTLGATIGGYAVGSLGISPGDMSGQVLMATVGATISIFAMRLASRTARSSQGYTASRDSASVPIASPVPLIRRPSRAFGNAALSHTDMTSHLG